MPCIASCCLCISRGWLWFRLFVFLSWVEPGDEFVNEEPVEYAYEDQAFDNSENLAGKMTIPSKSLLSLLASCSLYCYAALPTTCYIMPPILPCQASNHPFLANRCLAKLPLLLSPSYSVASCRWSWSWFHAGTWILLGYHNISYLFNASIYFGKGWKARPYAWCFVPLLPP